MIWLGYFLLLVVALGGAGLVILTWPGLWLMTGAAATYALVTHAHYLGARTLMVLLGLSIGAEILEWLLAKSAARKSGGGASGAIGAFVGGIVGGFAASFSVPIVGTILGICAGSFCGAAIAEWLAGEAVTHSLRVGAGAAKSRLLGYFGKIIFAGAMLLVIVVMAFP